MKSILFCIFLHCLALSCLRAGDEASLVLQHTIPLPGVLGRFDHAAFDPATNRLFFAALGNNTLEVVDVAAGKHLHSIRGLQKPTGVAFLPEEKLLVIANGGDGTCRFFDANTYAERGRVSDLDDADNLRFDAKAHRLYLGYGDGSLGVIDPATMKLLQSIPLPQHPESFQLEKNGPRIFINVPDAKSIVVVDRNAAKTVATWATGDLRSNFPMALDEAEHRLFIGFRSPARVGVFDTESGQRVAEAALSTDIDDLFYDGKARRLMASCGGGAVDLFQYSLSEGLSTGAKVPTRVGARTSYFSTEAGLCIAVPNREKQDAEIRCYRFSESREK